MPQYGAFCTGWVAGLVLSLSVLSLIVVESVVVVFESLLLLQEMIAKIVAERMMNFFTSHKFPQK